MAEDRGTVGPWNIDAGVECRQVRRPVTLGYPDVYTLACVFPTCVYARPSLYAEWTEFPTKEAADEFLRAAGWVLA